MKLIMNKIVITGIGTISPHGFGKDIFWESVQRGTSLLSQGLNFGVERSGAENAALIQDFDERLFLDSKAVKYLQRSEKLAIVASKLALSDAGLDSTRLQDLSIGIAIGSIASNLRAVAAFDHQVLCGEANYVDPSLVPSGIMNSLSGNVSINNKIRGFHVPIAAGEASGIQAIQFALTQLEAGRVDAVLAGGVDEIYDELYEVSALAEGAALLVLEPLEQAAERNARPYAECAGFGFSYAPGCHANREQGVRSAIRAMQQSCRDAEIDPAEIDLVFVSANGSSIVDAIEIEALKSFFGNCPVAPPLTCIRTELAKSLGASGALQVAAAALTIENSTRAFKALAKTEINHVLINSFSSDGHMSCLVLRRVGP